MSDEYKENLDAEVQETDTSVDSSNGTLNESQDSDSSDGSENADEKYLNAKRRAEKAESDKKDLQAKLRALTGDSTEEKVQNRTEQTGLSREEAILFARGLTEEAVNQIDKIAKIEGISKLEAAEGDYFKTWKKTQEEKAKSEKAQLGTSKGSPRTPEKKGLSTPGLTRDEHMELFKNNK